MAVSQEAGSDNGTSESYSRDMTNMQERTYNGGTLVGRKVSLAVSSDDAVEYLVNAIREAALTVKEEA